MITKNKLKQYQQLQSKKFRQKYGQFVVEGLKSVAELLNSSYTVDCILCTDASILYGLDTKGIDIHEVDRAALSKVSSMSTSPELLAIVQVKQAQKHQGNWAIALDGINDPGNLGTIIRIADWYGIKNIYCSPDTVELHNPKVIQSSMGSFTRVDLIYGQLEYLLIGQTVYAALLEGKSIRQVETSESGVLLIGSESHGISATVLEKLSHQAVTIPRKSDTESLNAAIATAICLERLMF